MVSHKEREQLIRNHRDEPSYGLSVVFNCASCLIFVVFIATIATRVGLQPEMHAAAPIQIAATQVQ